MEKFFCKTKKTLKIIIVVLISITILNVFNHNVFAANKNSNSGKVTTRNLAMFASLAYADLEKIPVYTNEIVIDTNENDKLIEKFKYNKIGKIDENELTFKETRMVTDAELSKNISGTTLLGIPLSDEEEDTYSYLFYGLASTEEVSDWKIVNYTKFRTTVMKGTAEFTAMTFKRGNDIVIAYRGTDFDDAGDWIQDLMYGLIGYAGQENVAKDYAKMVAKHYIEQNDKVNIYVTGHSLGGYLAQIGGSALVEDGKYVDNVKEIGYFNGMGLYFFSNIVSNIKPKTNILTKYNISKTEYKQITDDDSKLNRTQAQAKKALTKWKNNGGKLISYNINGDIISALGTHIGEQKGFDAYNSCINHHKGNQLSKDYISQSVFKIIKAFLNKDISIYVEKYRPKDILNYVWITHETDSFFGVLPYENGIVPEKIDAKIEVPSSIKYGKYQNATLTINTTNKNLKNEKLDKKDFILSKDLGLKIVSVSKPTVIRKGNGYEYKYTIRLRGGILIGNSNITLRPNVLEVKGGNGQLIRNNILVSKDIKTKLR